MCLHTLSGPLPKLYSKVTQASEDQSSLLQSLGSFVQTALTPCPRDSLTRGQGPRSLWHSCSFRRALWDLLGFPMHGGQPRPSVKQTFFGPHRWDEVVASVLHHGPWLPLRLPCEKEPSWWPFHSVGFPTLRDPGDRTLCFSTFISHPFTLRVFPNERSFLPPLTDTQSCLNHSSSTDGQQ